MHSLRVWVQCITKSQVQNLKNREYCYVRLNHTLVVTVVSGSSDFESLSLRNEETILYPEYIGGGLTALTNRQKMPILNIN